MHQDILKDQAAPKLRRLMLAVPVGLIILGLSAITGVALTNGETFNNDSLLRTPDKKIYVIIEGKKFHLTSLLDLHLYQGEEINDVNVETLEQYDDYDLANQSKRFVARDLVRAPNGTIYYINDNFNRIPLTSYLWEREKNSAPLQTCSYPELLPYPRLKASDPTSLYRTPDHKIYKLTCPDGTYDHVRSLAELQQNYAGWPVVDVDADEFDACIKTCKQFGAVILLPEPTPPPQLAPPPLVE